MVIAVMVIVVMVGVMVMAVMVVCGSRCWRERAEQQA
jgi:hypothetical protein